MNEAELEAFRRRARAYLFERMTLKAAFQVLRLGGGLSTDESRQALHNSLDLMTQEADAYFGARLQDPALTGLYADELKAIVEDIKKEIDGYADNVKAQGL